MSDDDRVDIYAERIEQAFGRPPTLLAAADRVNTILFAFREGPQRISWSVLEKCAKALQDQFGLPGNHYLASLRRLNKPVGGTTGSKNGNDSDDKFFAF